MPEPDDHQLLAEFTCAGAEPAFAALVTRYVNLVYSTAFRSTGNAQNSEEITQAVFVILARKAGKLSPRVVLSGWLYQTARLTAANFMKGELRRRRREEEAAMQSILNEPTDAVWREIAPVLDEAMGRLGQTDRDAVVLRYFENKSVAEIGAALRMNEEAARRRVNRALEKLRRFFLKRGVDSAAATIGETISARSIQTAPVALAKTVTAVALAKGATASTSTLTLIKGALKIMAWTNAKTAIVIGIASVIIAGTSTVLVREHLQAWQFTPAIAPWSDAGASTPKAALQTLAWALTTGKVARAEQLMQWEETNTNYHVNPFDEHQLVLQSILAPAVNDLASFQILSVTPTASNELLVKFRKTFKQGKIVPFTVTAKLRRVGRQWRVIGRIDYYRNGSVSTRLPFTGSF